MTSTNATDTIARPDAKKNRVLLIVSLAMAGGGISLVGLGLQREWEFLALFWSSVPALIGVGWVVGLLAGGGQASAGCPHCGAPIHFMHIESARTERCDRCGEWSAGIESMRPLAPDHVATTAVFPVPLPSGDLRWPTDSGGMQRCPVCTEVSTRSIDVRTSSALGSAFAALSPISVQRIHSLHVPACSNHDDGVVLDMLEDDHSLVLLFRSFAYFHEFVALNAPAPMPDMPDKPTEAPTLAAFLQHNPRPIEVRAPLTCPKHDIPVLTTMGWVSIMDLLPSNDWLDAAAEHPVCLDLGKHLERPSKGKHEPGRVAWCPACEAGMRSL